MFNITATATAGLGGIMVARLLGPTVRGEYAAVTAWFGITLMVGGMGQPAALCYFVARDPASARSYVATSRVMMLVTGSVVVVAGIAIAPWLARGLPQLADAYRITFAASIVAFVGASYTFSLQARDIRRWNLVRLSQPVLGLAGIAILWVLNLLSLQTAMISLAVTMLIQLGLAYWACRSTGLTPGRARKALVRPLASYGMAQIAALTPAAVNTRLDQIVLSQTVPSADLGRYAVAASLTLLPLPLVAAIGNVTFPELAARRHLIDSTLSMQQAAVTGSIVLSTLLLAPIAISAPWLVPAIYGSGYSAAVPMIWVLTPGAIFLGCGQVVGDMLRGRSHPEVVAWAQSVAAVGTIVLLLALLPLIGVYGAAVASTLSYGIALTVMTRRLFHLPRHARSRAPSISDSDRKEGYASPA